MPRNKSERFPYSEAMRKYLIAWQAWDVIDRPMEGMVRHKQRTAYHALSTDDRRVLRHRLRVPTRRTLISQFNLDGT